MTKQWLGALAVLAAAASIVAYNKASQPENKAPVQVSEKRSAAPTVVLIADLSEANDPCTCGEIIRSVRSAAEKGVLTKEIDPAKSPDVAASYGVRVAPAVLLLDPHGKEVRRFEGESTDMLTALRSALDPLTRLP
jgi:thioredoxin-like negative regulator of GroEL